MLKELRFVMGSVAKKDFLPALTHFKIAGGRVRGFNGTIALSSPIALDIDCTPKAETLVRAIQHCEETVQLALTPAGRLSIRSGPFKAFVDCVDTETPHVEPTGERLNVDGEALLSALKAVAPFMADDASRPWSNGVLLRGQSAFATNNVMLVEYWVGVPFPEVWCIPRPAVKEMLRINEPPVYAQGDAHSLSLHYEDGRWIRTSLLSTEWPDLASVLDRASEPAPVPEGLFAALTKLKPFADKLGRVYFDSEGLTTTADAAEGARVDFAGLPAEGVYQIDMLQLLEGVAQTVDWSTYPKPCMFFGDRLRGAIVGMRG